MKAAMIRRFGDVSVLEYGDLPTPEPGPGELLIAVAACGINRYDLYLRMGAVFPDIAFPHVLGADVAGTVAAIGDGVSEWKNGDRCIAAPGYAIDPEDWNVKPENMAPSFEVTGTHSWGGNAQFLRIPARFVLRDPSDLPFEQVAAMPLVMMTAVHAVQTLGQVKSGSSVLVQAGASGSGSACVQDAKLLGAKVATTIGSDEKAETARGIGADLIINHRRGSFADMVLDWTDGVGVDVVIDNVGASVFEDNLRALRLGGALVTFGLVGGYKTQIDLRRLFFRQHRLLGSFMGSLDEFRTGMTWVFERRVHAVVDKSFPLYEVAEAHRYIESRAVRGKVVLLPS